MSNDNSDDWQPSANLHVLRQRARLLQQIRLWFASENVLEVETPQISAGATTDPHIDSFFVTPSGTADQRVEYPTEKPSANTAENPIPKRCLRTSAEFHMKRLLAAGSGDIYELGKVFRVDESGRHHNPEFTMLEWYRVGIDHHRLIDDVDNLLRRLHSGVLAGANTANIQQSDVENCSYPGLKRISYRDLWRHYGEIDLANTNCAQLVSCLERLGCDVPESIVADFDTLLDLGMSTVICQQLATDCYTCIYDYPASQASLARIDRSDPDFPVASRFEFYYGSLELANGFHELTDASEQRERFEADNRQRRLHGKPTMPIDEQFIASLQSGMPDCSGVAIGVDRLLMVMLPEIESLRKVLSFNWSNA